MIRSLCLFFCLSFLNNGSFANYDFNDNCKIAYSNIINFRFEEGGNLLKTESNLHPDNLIPIYIENYIDFLTLFISEDRKKYNLLIENKKDRIDKLENGDQKSPYYLYCIAELNMQWAMVHLKFGEYVSAAWELNKAYSLLSKNSDLFPEFLINHKSLGVMHALIGTIPDEYKWLTKIIGFKGTIKQGIDELAVVIDATYKKKNFSYLKTEAIFLLTFVELNLQNKKDEIKKIYQLFESPDISGTIKESPLLIYSKSTLEMRNGMNDAAIQTLQNRSTASGVSPFCFLDYLTGVAKLNRLDKDAYKYFYSFLLNFKGVNYVKSSYLKLSWFYLLNDDIKNFNRYKAYTIKYGSTTVDEDKQALVEAKQQEVPNVFLLKARLLFDGGYFKDALSVLFQKSPIEICKTRRDQIEFSYRVARIYHENGDISKAIIFYQNTISNGRDETFYFAANASLQLGLIYEIQGDKEMAKLYFNKAMNMNNTEYRNSIELKAKAGLNRLDN